MTTTMKHQPTEQFQSTLPRRERRSRGDTGGSDPGVSIHAPTKGATCSAFCSPYKSWFQSTLPRRERRLRPSASGCTGQVSIHAPTKGATWPTYRSTTCLSCFNPRSHEGSDLLNVGDWLTGWMFQSTLPRRERRRLRRNSFSHSSVSIHAPTKGATPISIFLSFGCVVSIHAPTKGATGRSDSRDHSHSVSIHAPTKGATEACIANIDDMLGFNPRSHEGSDQLGGGKAVSKTDVSIHAPTKGATQPDCHSNNAG